MNQEFHVIDIDEHRLDEEWINQPKMYFEWAEKLAEARKDHEEAKAHLDIVTAEKDLDIRRHPKNYELTKLTESMVNQAIIRSHAHQEAKQRVIETHKQVNMLYGFVTALDHRKKALENLVILHNANYYAKPQESASGSAASIERRAMKKRRAKKMEEKYGSRTSTTSE